MKRQNIVCGFSNVDHFIYTEGLKVPKLEGFFKMIQCKILHLPKFTIKEIFYISRVLHTDYYKSVSHFHKCLLCSPSD